MILTVSRDSELEIRNPTDGRLIFKKDLAADMRRDFYDTHYDLQNIHLMPDNNTLYYNLKYASGGGRFYGLDLRSGAQKELFRYNLSDGTISVSFSPNSQYFYEGSLAPPGDGVFRVGTVADYSYSELKRINLVRGATAYSNCVVACLGPYVAYAWLQTLEVLDVRKDRVFRFTLDESDHIYNIGFSWFEHMLVVDWEHKFNRRVTVIRPSEFSKLP